MQLIAWVIATYQSTWEGTVSELQVTSTYTELPFGVKLAVANNDINGMSDPNFSKQ
jgi:hypothetical protein